MIRVDDSLSLIYHATFDSGEVWGVITVKNKCSIMISTISIMTLRYAIVPLQYDLKIMGSNDCPN